MIEALLYFFACALSAIIGGIVGHFISRRDIEDLPIPDAFIRPATPGKSHTHAS